MNFDDYCESVFAESRPCWHLFTQGDLSGIIFREREDYVFGMNLVALCAGRFLGSVRLYTFQIMSNHFHFVLSGEKFQVEEFYNELYRRLRKYLALKGRISDIKGIRMNVLPIEDLSYMRNVIAYVNRNGYLIDDDSTPFSYPWGANACFYRYESSTNHPVLLNKLTIRAKRKIFRTHLSQFPAHYYMEGGMVPPQCYVQISVAESFYRNAHHYFNLISRRVESFAQMAKELGDKVTYTDDELYTAVYSISTKKFETSPKILTKHQKIEVAKELHYSYNASNKQIKRVLRLDESVVNELFPKGVSSSR